MKKSHSGQPSDTKPDQKQRKTWDIWATYAVAALIVFWIIPFVALWIIALFTGVTFAPVTVYLKDTALWIIALLTWITFLIYLGVRGRRSP